MIEDMAFRDAEKEDKNFPVLCSQYHDCWCPCDASIVLTGDAECDETKGQSH